MKRIRKTYQGVVPNGKVLGVKNDSEIDTYNCKYINKLTTYSTEEQIVGTYISPEGIEKNLYRKTIESSIFSTDFYSIGDNIDTFIRQYGYVQRKDYPDIWHPIPSGIGSSDMAISFLANNKLDGIQLDWGSNWKSNNAALFNKLRITVEYTKTTD